MLLARRLTGVGLGYSNIQIASQFTERQFFILKEIEKRKNDLNVEEYIADCIQSL